jgi:hypothetical protein
MNIANTSSAKVLLQWNWEAEHEDRRKEARMDRAVHNAQPFQVDRRVLKDVAKEKLGIDVARIVYLSSGKVKHVFHHLSC